MASASVASASMPARSVQVQYAALQHLVQHTSTPNAARRETAKVMDLGDMPVIFADIDWVRLCFSTPPLERAFVIDAFKASIRIQYAHITCVLGLLLLQWSLLVARHQLTWWDVPDHLQAQACAYFLYLVVRVGSDVWLTPERAPTVCARLFVAIHCVPHVLMLLLWLLRGSGARPAPAAGDPPCQDSPDGVTLGLVVFLTPLLVHLQLCTPNTRFVLLSLTGLYLSMLPSGVLPGQLLVAHLVGWAVAHFLELASRTVYMRLAILLVQMRQQLAADSKLNHLLKNKCAEARAEIEALQDTAENPEVP